MTELNVEAGTSGIDARQLKFQGQASSLITSMARRDKRKTGGARDGAGSSLAALEESSSENDASLGKRQKQEQEVDGGHANDTLGWEDQENTQLEVSKEAAATAAPASISVVQHIQQAPKPKGGLTNLLHPIYTLVHSGQQLVQHLVPMASPAAAAPPGLQHEARASYVMSLDPSQQQQQKEQEQQGLASSSSLVTASSGEGTCGGGAAGGGGGITASVSMYGQEVQQPEVTCVSPCTVALVQPAAGDQTEATTGCLSLPAGQYAHLQQQQAASCPDMDVDEEEDEDDLLDPFLFISRLPPLEQCVCAKRTHLLPRKTRNCKQKTLVLDLDETLVHSTLDAAQGAGADFHFPVHFNGAEHLVFVRQRPHVSLFLERVAAHFEVVVFTASQKVYAERLLNILDPKRTLIRHRIYRDSCVLVEGNYLKDLSVLGRDLAATAIVDNSPQAFGFQLDNGIPIESWYEDKDDQELLRLLPFLEELRDVEDVRPAIQARFRMRDKVAACTAAVLTAVANTGAAVGVSMALAPPVRVMPPVPQAQAQQA